MPPGQDTGPKWEIGRARTFIYAMPPQPLLGGWLGTREGIDDARYLNTLCRLLQKKFGNDETAWAHMQEVLAPVNSPEYKYIDRIVKELGGYDKMRERIVKEILANQSPQSAHRLEAKMSREKRQVIIYPRKRECLRLDG